VVRFYNKTNLVGQIAAAREIEIPPPACGSSPPIPA
jgi:hypothetical protein